MYLLNLLENLWIGTSQSAIYDLPADYDLPKIRFATPTEINAIRLGAFAPAHIDRPANNTRPAHETQSIVAVYQDKERTIVLPEGWLGETPAESSILVHEMVHHIQNIAGVTYSCPQRREALAYDAQEKWLGLFNRSLLSEFEIDPMTLLISTKCLH
jgi:hypothetical protein